MKKREREPAVPVSNRWSLSWTGGSCLYPTNFAVFPMVFASDRRVSPVIVVVVMFGSRFGKFHIQFKFQVKLGSGFGSDSLLFRFRFSK
ncbi:hypothetical protein Hanom_Chr09g00798291 [Helianthus anomalus]